MNTIDKALLLSKNIIKYVKSINFHGTEEILISDIKNEKFSIRVFISKDNNEVYFKKENSDSYIVVSNGSYLSSKKEFHLDEIINTLNLLGYNFIEKLIRMSNIKEVTRKINSKKTSIEIFNQLERITNKLVFYKKEYLKTNDDKFIIKYNKNLDRLKKACN